MMCEILQSLVDQIKDAEEEVAFYRKLITEAETVLADSSTSREERYRLLRNLPGWRKAYANVLEWMYISCTNAENTLLKSHGIAYIEVFKLRKTAFKCMNDAHLIYY